jgi:lantibiotic modifying enzyme
MSRPNVISQSVEEGIPMYLNEVVTSHVKLLHKDKYELLPNLVRKKIHSNLVKELSRILEKTLQDEPSVQAKNGKDDLILSSNKIVIDLSVNKYPYLNEILTRKEKNISKHISNIISRFVKDRYKIALHFNTKVKPSTLKIVDVDLSLGDEHNGESTAVVTLSDGIKVIYKPRNCSITKSYNSFINWVNNKLQIDLPTFSVLDCGDYGWLEFVTSKEIRSEEGLQEYYYKAGVLVSVTYLLGSKDYHNENVIASAKGPVIIDHETIIQPFLKNSFSNSWYELHGIPSFSVLESSLIAELDKRIPVNMIGYGMKGVSPDNVVQKNVPKHKSEYVFAYEYKDYFIRGFSDAYDMFVGSKQELRSNQLITALFANQEVRFVWRPTDVYAKILRYLRNPFYLTSCEAYQSKLFELLSKAYKKENMRPYESILDHEMKQMLNGDIPIFHLLSHDNYLKSDKRLDIFEYNSLENIYYRINLLSAAHKNEQLRYITKWLNAQA